MTAGVQKIVDKFLIPVASGIIAGAIAAFGAYMTMKVDIAIGNQKMNQINEFASKTVVSIEQLNTRLDTVVLDSSLTKAEVRHIRSDLQEMSQRLNRIEDSVHR